MKGIDNNGNVLFEKTDRNEQITIWREYSSSSSSSLYCALGKPQVGSALLQGEYTDTGTLVGINGTIGTSGSSIVVSTNSHGTQTCEFSSDGYTNNAVYVLNNGLYTMYSYSYRYTVGSMNNHYAFLVSKDQQLGDVILRHNSFYAPLTVTMIRNDTGTQIEATTFDFEKYPDANINYVSFYTFTESSQSYWYRENM